ncbi:hypothetical protein ONZ45_g18833 [Pleurotus djamor]|nr:hypothetical protein ONZ45_g18833 [Pleurotus djamor]
MCPEGARRQHQLGVQIQEYEAIIRSFKSERNTHSDISQLPDEILALIMIARRDGDVLSPRPSCLDWLSATAVCRHWRQVSLDTPSLWSYIDLEYGEKTSNCAEIFLERSKSAPLSLVVSLNPKFSDFDRLMRLFVETMTTRELKELGMTSFKPTDEMVGDLMEFRPNVSAPYLTSLDLDGNYRNIETSTDYLWPEMPALCYLHLVNMPVPKTFPHLPKLYFLTMTTPIGQIFPISRALQILQQTPLVETVVLSHLHRESSMDHMPHVILPNLSTLELKADTFEVSRVLDYLAFPTATAVSLSFSKTSTIGQFGVRELWRHFSTAGIEKASIITCSSGSFKMQFFHPSHHSLSPPTLSIEHPYPVIPFIPLIHLFGVDLVTFERMGSDWGELLPYFDNIPSLTLVECNLEPLGLLKPPLTSGSNDGEGLLMLPKLKRLALEGYRFGQPGRTVCMGDEHRKLSALLEMRKIQMVTLSRGSATPSVRRHFARRNMEIEWENYQAVRITSEAVESGETDIEDAGM